MTTTVYSSTNDLTFWTPHPQVTVSGGIRRLSTAALDSPRLDATVGMLRPGVTHTVTVHLSNGWAANTLGMVTIMIQGVATKVMPPLLGTTGMDMEATGTVDPSMPVTISVDNITAATLQVAITAPDTLPDDPEPCDVLAAEVWAPRPSDALVWDKARWDRTRWDRPSVVPGTLIWDEGTWGGSVWMDWIEGSWWTSILGPATTIETRRGMATSGPVLKAEAGTMTIAGIEDLDPRRVGIVYGSPVRVWHWPTRTPVWTGTITDLSTEPLKDGGTTVTITAADAVARMVATKPPVPLTVTGTTAWHAAVNRACETAGLSADVSFTTGRAVAATLWEATSAEMLDALVATSGGWWTATRDGRLDVRETLTNQASRTVHVLTDTHDTVPPLAARLWCYTDAVAAWSAADLLAKITATVHGVGLDDKSEWVAVDTEVTATNLTTATTYGGQSATVDLVSATADDAKADATRLLRRAVTVPLLKQATIRPVSALTKNSTQGTDMAAAARIDPGQLAATVLRDETATQMVTSVAHTITPATWATTLTLTPIGDTE